MIAVDTNVLVHAHRKNANFHKPSFECIKSLAEGERPWAICYHTLVEFYGVSTHPKIWENPSTPAQIEEQIQIWKESPTLHILTDQASDMDYLVPLAVEANVKGPMIHDARVAACCLNNGVSCLYSFDRDFSRFPELRVKSPLKS